MPLHKEHRISILILLTGASIYFLIKQHIPQSEEFRPKQHSKIQQLQVPKTVRAVPKQHSRHKRKRQTPKEIEVEIRGAIHFPGVYKVIQGTGFHDLIKKAGGLTTNSNPSKHYKNYKLKDGQSYFIHYKEDYRHKKNNANSKKTPPKTVDTKENTFPILGQTQSQSPAQNNNQTQKESSPPHNTPKNQ